MKNVFIVLASLFLTINGFSQKKFLASGDIFGRRVFIKNNGQFDKILPNQTKTSYAYVNGDEQVYFHNEGVSYLLQKQFPITHHQKEELEHGKKITIIPTKKYFINVSWENANTNIQIIENEKQSFYHSFGDAELKSDCFKKITYKNVYNNIDIEYLFTNERDNGIKYNVVVHPGGNLNDVKIKYSGDVEGVILKKGNVIIKTPLQDIIESAPKSFQAGNIVASEFSTANNIITFNLPTGYDNTKELIIDPWITNLALTTNNYAYDVDHDVAGNYYVYGGSGPFLISKYTPAGALVWTFGGTVPSQGWTSLGSIAANKYTGNFLVDKITGKSYTGEGFNNGVGTRIVRIDQNGIYDNFISAGVAPWNELWDMGYNCSNGNVFGLGGSITNNSSCGILNTISGAIVPQNFTGTAGTGQDVASHAIDNNGVIFLLFASGQVTLNNRLMRVNAAFTGNTWIAPTTYATMNESNNKFYPGAGMPGMYSNGYNALAANGSFLYYYDGLRLAAYNKTTGAIVASTTVPGQTILQQGGIAVDDCNNLYLGGNNQIRCYSFNGTNFTPNGNIPLGATTINKFVTDIKYTFSNNELFVSGTGFGGIFSAINSTTCTIVTTSINTICATTGIAIATVSTNIVNPVISYSWTNSSNVTFSTTANSPLLTNTVTGLANGNYTVYTQVNAPCGPINTQTFNINCVCSLTALATSSCSGAGLTTSLSLGATLGLTATPLSFAWTGPNSFSSTNTSTTLVNAAPGVYTLNATTPVCAASGTVLVIAPSSFTPVLVSTNTSCFNGSNGTTSVSAITGTSTAPYTYSWSTTPPQNTALATGLTAGNYTCTVTDTKGCVFSASVNVGQPAPAFLTLASTSVSCFNGSNGTASIVTIPIANTSPYTYTWSSTPNQNTAQASSLTAGTYTCALTDNLGCVFTGTTTVIQPASSVSVTSTSTPSQTCIGNNINLTATGAGGTGPAYTYSWSNNSTTAVTTVNEPTTGFFSYSVTAFDANLCSANSVITVTFIPNPSLIVTNKSMCFGESTNINVNGATTYSWSPAYGLNTTVGSFVVANPTVTTLYTITGNNLICTTTNTVLVTVVPIPDLNISCAQQQICAGNSTQIFASGAQNYVWSPTNSLTFMSPSSVGASPLATGEYTIIGINSSGTTSCSAQKMMPIVVVPQVTPSIIPNKTICFGEKATFIAGGGNTFTWTPSLFLNNTTSSGVVSSATANIIYTVSVSNNGVCANTTTVSLTVNPLPKVFAGRDTTCNLDDQIYINATGTGTITWVSGDNITCKDCPNTQIIPKYTGCYIAESVNEFGCKVKDEVCINITTDHGIYIPSAFTPNGDGLNDIFLVYGHSISEVKMDIFDRWGEKLFSSNDMAKGWNGVYKNVDCEIGVYVYKVTYKGLDNKKHEKVGHVTLNK